MFMAMQVKGSNLATPGHVLTAAAAALSRQNAQVNTHFKRVALKPFPFFEQ
jgi:hypothetical protein